LEGFYYDAQAAEQGEHSHRSAKGERPNCSALGEHSRCSASPLPRSSWQTAAV